ncbi:MAG TPA: DUF934 domain-containing protein [Steroidobacteraceae bacterium]|jgi:uncharacterized protein (DUF934 family)|nr:DUF934 domain-containing protein [Steroidobacteraceae bacterium]
MQRRLLRDGRIVVDEWRYVTEAADDASAPLIVSLDQWRLEPDTWLARGSLLGLVLSPAHDVEQLAPDLKRFALIAAQFSGPSEGRGYSQARQLRDRWNFKGELRAVGYVRRDQLFFMARCGFNSFELAENDIDDAYSAFSTFTAAYQPSNDAGLAHRLRAAAASPQGAVKVHRAAE